MKTWNRLFFSLCRSLDDDVNLDNELNVYFSNGPLKLFISMVFDDIENAQTFYKIYAIWKYFVIWTNHTWLSKDKKKLIGVDYICLREGFWPKCHNKKERTIPIPVEAKIGCKVIMKMKKWWKLDMP